MAFNNLESNIELDKNIVNILANLSKKRESSSVSLCDIFDCLTIKHNLNVKQQSLSNHIRSIIKNELLFRTSLEISEKICYKSRLQKFIINFKLTNDDNEYRKITSNIIHPNNLLFPNYIPEQIKLEEKCNNDKYLQYQGMTIEELQELAKQRAKEIEKNKNTILLMNDIGNITHKINLTNERTDELSKTKVIIYRDNYYVVVKRLPGEFLTFSLSNIFEPAEDEVSKNA